MFPRKRLDISVSDMYVGLSLCAKTVDRDTVQEKLERLWTADRASLATFSVRTGFDMLLTEMDWEEGSEIVMTSVTIPHMAEIIRHHGYVPVPVEMDVRTCETPVALIEASLTPRTRAVMVTQLFGTRVGLEPVLDLVGRHGLMLIEDCAQAFQGVGYAGDPRADISMFSFGTIKSATAMGGAMFSIKDPALRDALDARQRAYPIQPQAEYAKKLLKNMSLVVMGKPRMYSLFVNTLRRAGKDHDAVIRSMSRGFAGPDFFQLIRRQMSDGLLAMLYHRLSTYDPEILRRRAAAGRTFASMLKPHIGFFGPDVPEHSFWLFPVIVENTDEVITAMRAEGFDATSGSSTLIAIEPAPGEPTINPATAQDAMAHIVYVPVYDGIPNAELQRMADVLNRVGVHRELPALPSAEAQPLRAQIPEYRPNVLLVA